LRQSSLVPKASTQLPEGIVSRPIRVSTPARVPTLGPGSFLRIVVWLACASTPLAHCHNSFLNIYAYRLGKEAPIRAKGRTQGRPESVNRAFLGLVVFAHRTGRFGAFRLA